MPLHIVKNGPHDFAVWLDTEAGAEDGIVVATGTTVEAALDATVTELKGILGNARILQAAFAHSAGVAFVTEHA